MLRQCEISSLIFKDIHGEVLQVQIVPLSRRLKLVTVPPLNLNHVVLTRLDSLVATDLLEVFAQRATLVTVVVRWNTNHDSIDEVSALKGVGKGELVTGHVSSFLNGLFGPAWCSIWEELINILADGVGAEALPLDLRTHDLPVPFLPTVPAALSSIGQLHLLRRLASVHLLHSPAHIDQNGAIRDIKYLVAVWVC